ncbi:hypothetical protein [Ornithinimicrobium cavernae]|uniref:hypothetical protein n=1 Tax=Ornithinimicrobium cavernae TaxID=2666047 RepID=UPI00137A88AA|nr:hypothetical protein [Ornithinimicrobium cavernae]
MGTAIGVLLCAGCSDGEDGSVEVTTTDSAGRTTVVTQEVTEDPEPSPDDAATTTTTFISAVLEGPEGTGVAFDLPDTWSIQTLGEAERTAAPDPEAVAPVQWCLVPPSAPPAIDGCSGVLVALGPDWLPGHAGAAYSLRQVEGWRSTPGPLSCPLGEEGTPVDVATVTSTPDDVEATADPTPDDTEVDLLVTAAEGMPLTTTQSEVDGRTVTYETWRAACSLSEDVVIAPQVWQDQDLGVLVRDYFGLPETVVIVESLREV